MDIFCQNCRHFSLQNLVENNNSPPQITSEKCLAPQLVDSTYKHEHMKKIGDPKIINKNNDCNWFEPIESENSSGE